MRASVFIATSLDGFIARPNGDLDWLLGAPGQNGEDYGYKAFMDTVDVLIMGRGTYEKVLTFGNWPYTGKQVVVLSSRLGNAATPASPPNGVELMAGEPAAVVAALAARGFRHAYVDGGRTIQGFLAAGLVQHLTITRIPVLIGTGLPLFGALPADRRLRHLATRSWPNGFVQSQYELVPDQESSA
jgi:dihydrofolate reductase